MKKVNIMLLITLLCILTSCNILNHEHIWGEWQYDEYNHWKPFIDGDYVQYTFSTFCNE